MKNTRFQEAYNKALNEALKTIKPFPLSRIQQTALVKLYKRFLVFAFNPGSKIGARHSFETLDDFSKNIAANGFDYTGSIEFIEILDLQDKKWLKEKEIDKAINKYSSTK